MVTGKVTGKGVRKQYGEEVPCFYLEEISSLMLVDGDFKEERVLPEGVLCTLSGENTAVDIPKLGSFCRLRGNVKLFEPATNPGEFDAKEYYRILHLDFQLQKVQVQASGENYNRLQEKLYHINQYFQNILDDCLPETDAAVMKAMLLGEKQGLSTELKSLYQQNGIIHILAISGLHISMMGMGLFQVMKKCRIPLCIAAFFSIVCMLLYGMMIGAGSSSNRAIFMFCLHVAAPVLGRTYDMCTALALSAMWLLLEQPLYLKHSGFLFSFGAVAAIGVFLPLFRFESKHSLLEGFSAGLCIAAVTLPIHIQFYYTFPLYSLILNLLVIPLMSVVLLDGIVCLSVGVFLPAVAGVIGLPNHFILTFYESLCLLCSRLPFHTLILGHAEKWQVIAYYVMLIGLLWTLKVEKQAVDNKRRISRWLVILAALCVLLFRPSSGINITVLDVGQGDGTCIETEAGHGILIDCGSSDEKKIGIYKLIPFLKYSGIHTLDVVFLSHLDADHTSGIKELLESEEGRIFRVKKIILAKAVLKDEAYEELCTLASANNIPIFYMETGDVYRLNDVTFTCLHPTAEYEPPVADDRNAASLILQMDYYEFNALFTGDADAGGEALAVAAAEQIRGKEQKSVTIEYLKTGHHGSSTASSEFFMEYLQPVFATISCGYQNRYGHPHKTVLDHMEKYSVAYFRTDESGAIRIETNGKKIKIKRYLER